MRPPDPSAEVPLLRGLRSHAVSLLQMMLSSSEPKYSCFITVDKSLYFIYLGAFSCVCYLLNVIVVIIIVRVSNIYWSVFHSVVFIELGSHGLLDCCLALLFTVEKNVQLKCCLAS